MLIYPEFLTQQGIKEIHNLNNHGPGKKSIKEFENRGSKRIANQSTKGTKMVSGSLALPLSFSYFN